MSGIFRTFADGMCVIHDKRRGCLYDSKNRHKYDIDVVRRELQQFPESMYEEWLDNRQHFVSKLLYMHIPRTTLWQLVSGIAFVELTTAEMVSISSTQKASEGQGEPSGDVHVSVNIGTAADVVAEGGKKIVNNNR